MPLKNTITLPAENPFTNFSAHPDFFQKLFVPLKTSPALPNDAELILDLLGEEAQGSLHLTDSIQTSCFRPKKSMSTLPWDQVDPNSLYLAAIARLIQNRSINIGNRKQVLIFEDIDALNLSEGVMHTLQSVFQRNSLVVEL